MRFASFCVSFYAKSERLVYYGMLCMLKISAHHLNNWQICQVCPLHVGFECTKWSSPKCIVQSHAPGVCAMTDSMFEASDRPTCFVFRWDTKTLVLKEQIYTALLSEELGCVATLTMIVRLNVYKTCTIEFLTEILYKTCDDYMIVSLRQIWRWLFGTNDINLTWCLHILLVFRAFFANNNHLYINMHHCI